MLADIDRRWQRLPASARERRANDIQRLYEPPSADDGLRTRLRFLPSVDRPTGAGIMLSALAVAAVPYARARAARVMAATSSPLTYDCHSASVTAVPWEHHLLSDAAILASTVHLHWRSLLTPEDIAVNDAAVRTIDADTEAARLRSVVVEKRRQLAHPVTFGSRSPCDLCGALIWNPERGKCCGNGKYVLRHEDCPQLPDDEHMIELLTSSTVMEFSAKINAHLAMTAVGATPSRLEQGRGFHVAGA
jgi:hypothetical protein